MKLLLLALAVSTVSANLLQPSCDKPLYCNSKLLHYVQMARIFPESKTFVDLHMKRDEKTIMDAFDLLLRDTKDQPSKQQLEAFVNDNFESLDELESWTPSDFNPEPSFLSKIKDIEFRQFAKNIVNLWPVLGRKVKPIVCEKPEFFSLIPVNNGFIVPGGKHKELYYWDTYWIVEGLLVSGMQDTVRGILGNLIDLQRKFGHIPNGNRWYYQQRSQPPLLSAMVMRYLEATHDVEFLKNNIDALESELQYWIDTHSVIINKDGKQYTLLRYYSPSKGPRPEWYYEDHTHAQNFDSEERREEFYTDIKSAAESGWDFSSRWQINNRTNIGNLTSNHASHIVPVDLNAIFTNSMQNMAYFYSLMRNSRKGAHWAHIAKQWSNSIQEVMWNDEDGIWYDWDLSNNCQRKYFYPSNIAPLWMDVVSKEFMKEKAQHILEYMKKTHSLEFPGGIPASFIRSGEQWDYPYARAPLVSMVVKSLAALKTEESKKLAFEVAQNWVRSNYVGYVTSKQLFDKYNVEAAGKVGSEEEYAVQAGFGWTNGAVLEMLAKYGPIMKAQDGYYNFNEYKSNPVFWHIPTSAHLPSYYKSSKTAPVLTDSSTFNHFVHTSSSTSSDNPLVVSSVSVEHTDVTTVSGKPEFITPLKPEEPEQFPSAPIKPEHIPFVGSKPELIPSPEVKPELIPSAPIKPEFVPSKPVHQEQIFSSEHVENVYLTESVHDLSTHQSNAHVSGEISYDSLVPSVSVKPQYQPAAPIKPEHIPSVEQKPQLIPSAEAKPELVSSEPSKPEFPQFVPVKPELISSAPVKPEFNPSLPNKPELIPLKPGYQEQILSDIYHSEHAQTVFPAEQVHDLSTHQSNTHVSKETSYNSVAPSVSVKPELIPSTEIKPELSPSVPSNTKFFPSKPDHQELISSDAYHSEHAEIIYPTEAEHVSSIHQSEIHASKEPEHIPSVSADQKPVNTAPVFGSSLETVSSSKPALTVTQEIIPSKASVESFISETSKSSYTGSELNHNALKSTELGIAGSAYSQSSYTELDHSAASEGQVEQVGSLHLQSEKVGTTFTSAGQVGSSLDQSSSAVSQTGNSGSAHYDSGFSGVALNTANNFAAEKAQLKQNKSPQTGFSVGYKPAETEKVSTPIESGNVGGAFSGSGFPGAVLNTASNFVSGQTELGQTAFPQTGFSVGYKPAETEKVSTPIESGNVGGAFFGSGFPGAALNTANNFVSGQTQLGQTASPQTGFSVGYKPAETEKVSTPIESGNVGESLVNTASNFVSGQTQLGQTASPQTGFSVGHKPAETEKVSTPIESGNVGGAFSGFPESLVNTASNFVSGQTQLGQTASPQTGFSVGYKPAETEKVSTPIESGKVGGAFSGSGFPGAVVNTASNFVSGHTQLGQTASPQTGFSVGYKPAETEKVSTPIESGKVGSAFSGFPGSVVNTASNFLSGQTQIKETTGNKPVNTGKGNFLSGLFG